MPHKNTLIKKSVPVVSEAREYNSLNGNDAEFLAGSRLILACGAEISWGSRNEDGRKIDLIISYDHPWIEKERLLVLIQVKSGDSYGKIDGEGFILESAAKTAAQRTSHNICIIWAERKTHKTFWAYIHPFTLPGKQVYGKIHSVCPATRYDLARCQADIIPGKSGGAGIIMTLNNGSLQSMRAFGKAEYRNLNAKKLCSPNLGIIEFTRIGWRHMFRKRRMAKRKESSLVTINYIKKIITDHPSDIYMSECSIVPMGTYSYRTAEYVLTFENVSVFDTATTTKTPVKVICRLIEEIRWPTDWMNCSTLSQQIDRRLIFRSCYYK